MKATMRIMRTLCSGLFAIGAGVMVVSAPASAQQQAPRSNGSTGYKSPPVVPISD